MRVRLAVALCCAAISASGCTGARRHPHPPSAQAPSTLDVRPDFVLPALEIVGTSLAFNAVGRAWKDDGSFVVTFASIRRNLRGPWVIDEDPFEINQLGHAYQGATNHHIARSAGLNYWQSLGYVFTASVLWELAGEATPPSMNDQVVTGIGGTFLGEALFRAANRLLAQADGRPGVGRRWLIAALSPPLAINRLAFGRRFDAVMPTHDPATDIRSQFGARVGVHGRPGSAEPAADAVLDLSLDYGLPGNVAYSYGRPFDYFHLRALASTASGMESLFARGLLAGRRAGAHSVWGVFGDYEYWSPKLFRVSTTALSIGLATDVPIRREARLRSSVTGGVAYGAAQTIDGPHDRDYHYGIGPQASASVSIVAPRFSIDLSTSRQAVGSLASFRSSGWDAVLRAEASVAMRVRGRHAIAARYQFSRRDVSSPGLGPLTQSRGTIGVFYAVLGSNAFGRRR